MIDSKISTSPSNHGRPIPEPAAQNPLKYSLITKVNDIKWLKLKERRKEIIIILKQWKMIKNKMIIILLKLMTYWRIPPYFTKVFFKIIDLNKPIYKTVKVNKIDR